MCPPQPNVQSEFFVLFFTFSNFWLHVFNVHVATGSLSQRVCCIMSRGDCWVEDALVHWIFMQACRLRDLIVC